MSVTTEDIREYKSRRNRIALLSALADVDPVIREAAVIALIEIADVRDVVAVKEYLMLESDLHIRGQVLPILHQTKIYDDPDFFEQFLLKNFQLTGAVSPDLPRVSVIPIQRSVVKGAVEDKKKSGQGKNRMMAIVFLVIAVFFLSLSISQPSGVQWFYMLLGILSGAMAFGIFKMGKSVKSPVDSVFNPDVPPVVSEAVKKEHFTRLFHHRDIFAMGILYEGELPENKSVTPSMIAREVVWALHQEERFVDSHLSIHAVVKMERVADYKFFSSEDYLPGTDLDDLLGRCMDEVKQRVMLDDPLIEKIAAQMSRVKVRTATLGVVWVGLYISMI